MATGLASQLNSLKTPQTSRLLQDQDKKRASLLFNPKEAANLDRETVFNIGKNGLDELIELSNVFQEFENIFFTHSATKLERSIQDKKINEKLNKKISEFLIFSSPYFLTDHARKALEWLIYRFQIHQYNKDDFMMMILPYHGTNQFVRALQLVDLSQNTDKWNWLKPLQKPGIQLSASILFNRIAVDNCLFELICNHIVHATTVYKEKATCLKTLYIFYTFVICGAIDKSTKITELQVNYLLPALLKGLRSPISDFAASAIVILGKLSMKQRLDDSTMTHLLTTALKNPILKHELMTLIFILYEAPNNEMTHVPHEIVNQMAEFPWLCDEIIKIKTSGIDIICFILPFLTTAIKIVLKNPDEMINVKTTVTNIIQKIAFDDDEIDMILREALKPGLVTDKLSKLSKSFLSELYGYFEVRYSGRFDEYLKTLMKESETCLKAKESLQFLMSWHAGAERAKDSLNTFDKLNHFAPEYRISALKDLSAGNVEISDNFEGMVKKSIIERFNDDNVDVVKALLDFPVKRLKSLFPSDNLIERLMILLSQCHTEKKYVLAKPALKLLLNLCVDGDDTSVFIAILPYLFPTTDEEVEIALQILNSTFSQKNPYLQDVSKEINEYSSAKAIGDAAFHSLLESELLPPTENILTTMKLSSNNDATSLFFNFVLLGSVCRRKIGEISPKTYCEIIELSSEMIKKYPYVKSIPNCNRLTSEVIQSALQLTSKGILPLLAGTYVLEMVFRRLNFKTILLDFENNNDFTQLIICIFELMLEGVHSTHEETKRHYSWILTIFVKRHLENLKLIIEFLAQNFIPPVKPETSFQCLRMALNMFDRAESLEPLFENKIFVTNLLIALSRENKTCREAATQVLKRLFKTMPSEMNGIGGLLSELYKRSTEIAMDHEQLPLILYTLLSPDPDVTCQLPVNLRSQMKEARDILFAISLDESIPIHIRSQLLEVLAHVNGASVLKTLTPCGLELMEIVNNDCDKPFTKLLLKNILYRFNSTTVDALRVDNVWKLFEFAFSNNHLRIPIENDHLPPSTIIMKQIDDIFFENVGKISGNLQKKILAKLVDVVTDCESSSIVAAANRAVQRIRIDGQFIVDELVIMEKAKLPVESNKVLTPAQAKRQEKRLEMVKKTELINTREWKRGITILEFIQRAENIDNEYLLIPVLFDLLKTCLKFEEKSPLEYTNQLVLSTIYNLLIKKLPISNAHAQVDPITQCIRTSQNPQTHHHALLVLVELFKIADIELALNNIMPIFTFMGSSVLRQDDAYSIQIISKIIETIVPVINASNDEKLACEVLRIFVVSLPDIPEHRRQPLFVKLLQLLENHLHLFYLLTFTAEVLAPVKKQKDKKELSQRLKFALRITQEFSPKKIINVCVKIMEFVKLLPTEIEESTKKSIKFSHKHIFDVAENKPKQLQDYKYLILQFLNNLLSSVDFVNSVAMLNEDETNEIQPSFDNMIVQLLLLIESTTKLANINQSKSKEDKSNYWRTLLHNLYEILNAVNSLLPNQVFITSVMKLMVHDELTVRRKALELLNTRLYYKKFNQEDHKLLLTLIIPLLEIVSKHGKMLSPELEKIQQTSLRSLQFLAKLLAVKNPECFKPVLELTTEYMRTKDGPLLSCIVLCVAELVGTMKIHAIPLLNKFVPSILHLVKTHCHQDSPPDHLVISIICAMQKIVDSVANFCSLYLDEMLVELCELTTRFVDLDNKNIVIIVSRLKATAQKLASCIPLRVMLPAVGKTYSKMMEMKLYKLIPSLMAIFAECFEYLQASDINSAIPELANFFLRVLQFREDLDLSDEELDEKMEVDDDGDEGILNDIRVIEEAAGKSFVCLVLKLSEAQFRPLCYKLYDWAARNPDKKLRSITFYRLSSNIAESLKLLSAQFSGHFLTHAAQLLVQNNLEIQSEAGEQTLENEKNRIELIESILSTLNKVFTYDANDFVNQERFETLCQPIVDQIENTVGTRDEFVKRAGDLIVPCVASFASAIQDDSLHKQLVYQVLLKTRHTKSFVRSTALSALVEIARKLGEDFMPLLPETVPFLAELLEDEDEATEKLAQNAVRTLEEILGEPLQKYF